MQAKNDLVVDDEKIKKAILSGLPLTITTYTFPSEIRIYIEQILTIFLKRVEYDRFKDYFVFIVYELIENAKRANTKRVFFAEQKLDIFNPEQYKLGMVDFKEKTNSNVEHYLNLQKNEGLYVKMIIMIKNNVINIEIRNNTIISGSEIDRINERMTKSRQYDSLEEAMMHLLDDSEGAGLGLVVMILMLRKMGFDANCFNINSTKTETIAKITIPLKDSHVDNYAVLSSTIVDFISSMPQFSESILAIQKSLNDPKTELSDIAKQISVDPALTAELLKMSNSVRYMSSKKISNISEAVKIVGLRGIKNLLFSYETQKVLGSETEEKKNLWEHSYKVAFYAYNLVKNFQRDRDLLDDIYVGGILHDMGKIIFSSEYPELLVKIKSYCTQKNISATILENLAAGMNHAEIGALVAEKWNFPDKLIAAIRYHHNPSGAPKEFQEVVFGVYLADMLCSIEKGDVQFNQIDHSVLENFGITNETQINSLLQHLSEGFQQAG